MYLIAGLGNPGLKYKYTRHNAGYLAIDAFAKQNGLKFQKKKFESVIAEGSIAGETVLLLKPLTFMNLSGNAIEAAASFYKIPSDHIIIIYDDIDLALGRLRIRASGSAGTHNGMRSIIARIKTQDFPRIRIGIDKNPPYMNLADYVLQKLKGDEKEKLLSASEIAADAISCLIKNGVEQAMASYNKK